jgi:hypothetical protein
MPEIIELPITVQASAGAPTAQNRRQFREKGGRMAKFVKKDTKKEYKFAIFSPIHFSQSDSYRTIGSPMLLVR